MILLMDPQTESNLRALYALASTPERKIPLETLRKAGEGFDPSDPTTRGRGIIPEDQTLELPLGWKVTISIEQQESGWTRHLSMSSPIRGRVPNPAAMQLVRQALGWMEPLERCIIYPEVYESGRIAINTIESLERNADAEAEASPAGENASDHNPGQ